MVFKKMLFFMRSLLREQTLYLKNINPAQEISTLFALHLCKIQYGEF